MQITRDEMEEIATSAVKQAFRDMGIQDGDPFEMRKDFAHLREWRITCEQIRGRGVISTVTLLMTGIIALLILGIKGWIFN